MTDLAFNILLFLILRRGEKKLLYPKSLFAIHQLNAPSVWAVLKKQMLFRHLIFLQMHIWYIYTMQVES